jgi:signal peptidase I
MRRPTGDHSALRSSLITAARLMTVAALMLGGLAVVLDIAAVPVLSPSMRPAIAEGDLLLVRPVATSTLQKGQVALLVDPNHPGRTFAHRLIEVGHGADGTTVRTRGDANLEPDPEVLVITARTTTVVAGRIPAIGRVVVAVGGPRVRLPITLGVIGLLVVAVGRSLVRPARMGLEQLRDRRPTPQHGRSDPA